MTRTLAARPVLAALVSVVLAIAGAAAPAAAELSPPPGPALDGNPPAGWPEPPPLSVPTYLLVEAATGQVLATEGADERRPVASTVKILTALTALDRVSLNDRVTVGDEVLGLEGASVSLTPGDTWTVEQLIAGLMVRSGNDAAEALAVHVGGDAEGFAAAMADTAERLGLPTGDDGLVLASASGLGDDNRLSASDLATLARVALAEPRLRAIVSATEVTLPGVGPGDNRNQLIGSYPGATGVKTGFTAAAGNSLVGSAERGGRELIVVVLGGGPDPARFVDAGRLLDHGFTAYDARELAAERTLLVAGGSRTLEVAPVQVTVPTGAVTELALPVPVRVPEPGTLDVPVLVDGVVRAQVQASVSGDDPTPVEGAAAIGRGAVDGVHAALRAAHAAGSLTAGVAATSSR